MATIDDKVVAMSFESSKFESGVDKTISAIDKLKAALNFSSAGKGLQELDSAGKKVDLSHISRGVDEISSKLGALRLIAVAAFAEIAHKAISTGINLAKAFTIDPMKAGFAEYSTNLNAIQTILANTQAAGSTLDDVNAALLDLNKYSDKTIYNFSQMAKNIGTFTAAGVDLKTSTASIKGIANLAALSGSNADQASTAMYQLSQAISAGAVKLQDWNSVVNAGMGGTVFQRALAQTAEAMGTIKKGAVQLEGPMKNVKISGESFRQSLSKPGKDSWLTSKVLTTTLQQFTGDLSDAQLKAEGFNAAQIKAIQQTAKTAMHAATEVKTLSQVLDVAKETAGSGWAQTWQIIFGNFTEAKTTFTALSNAINGVINANAAARNKILKDWKDLGGRTVLIKSITTAFHNLGLILKPIKEAFRDIFPPVTGKQLFALTKNFESFAKALKPSAETVANLHRTFKGFFAILDIGKQIVSGIFTVLGQLFHATGAGNGTFLSLTATIGDFFVGLDNALKKGDRLHNFFVKLGSVIAAPLKLIQVLTNALSDLFSGFSPGGFSDEIDNITSSMTPLKRITDGVSKAWDHLKKSFDDAIDMQSVAEGIAQGIQDIAKAISDAASGMNFEAILQVIRTGLFAGLVVMFKQFLGKGSLIQQLTGGGGMFSGITKSFGSLQGTMTSFQNNLKAKTLKEIAIAIALLTASVVALSFVDPKKLNSALSAMTIMFGELIGAMAILEKVSKTAGFIKLPLIVTSLIALAAAIDLLTIAVVAMSMLSWSSLTKGLAGVAILLGTVAAAVGPLGSGSAGLIRAGVGITAIAIALNLLAFAVKQFGNMNLQELGKGLGGVAIGLGVMTLAMQKMPIMPRLSTVSLIGMAFALNVLANAVNKFGTMNLQELGKGLGGMAVGLTAMVVAMRKMPKTMAVSALELLALAGALWIMSDAVGKMGDMSIEQLAKGLGTLGGSLALLAGGLYAMSGTLAGAAALAIAAGGLLLLSIALKNMGDQSLIEIAKGLIELAGALTIMGIASALLSEGAPAMLAFSVSLLAIGAAIALAGAGIFLFGLGLAAIAVAGPAAIAILIKALIDFTAAIGEMGKNLVLGLLEIVEAFAKVAPKFVDALVKIINSLLDVVIKASPKIAQAFTALIVAALKVLHDNQGKIIQAGFNLIIALLQGIKNNIKQVIATGADIIVNLLQGIASQAKKVVTAAVDTIGHFLLALSKAAVDLIDVGAEAIINFLNGVADTIEKREPEMLVAGARIGVAIVQGMINGIGQLAGKAIAAAENLAKSILGKIGGIFHLGSPSKETFKIGQYIVEGLALGMNDHKEATNSAIAMSNAVIDSFNETFQTASPSKVMMEIGKYVGQGFAQGLRGSVDDVKSAFAELNEKLTDAMVTARETIASEQEKLNKLREAKKPDADAIKEAQKIIAENESILARSVAAHKVLVVTLKDEKKELIGLVNEYQSIGDKLSAAKDKLAGLVQERKDLVASTTDQFSTLPDIVMTDSEGNPVDAVAMYQEALRNQVDAVAAYNATLEQLRKLGINKDLYEKLLKDGTADQQFASQVLSGGKTAVDGLNKLDKQLETTSKRLATNAADNLKQAGIDAAKGLVKGLQSQHDSIRKEMEGIARMMLAALRKELASHSPSERFAEIGKDAMAGLALGFSNGTKVVTDAVNQAAKDAMSAMKQSMRNIHGVVTDELNANPVITPILDLTQVRTQAEELAALTKVVPITAAASYGQASIISSQQTTAENGQNESVSAGMSIKFEQTNNSPESLSEIEIYRQTRNQLSQLKSVLAIT